MIKVVVGSSKVKIIRAVQRGADGVGVPPGGTTGQSLVKTSNADFDTEWQSVAGGPGGAVDSVNGQTGTVVLTKASIGLSAVDNTSDLAKPISTATQNALNTKQASIGYTPENTANKAVDFSAINDTKFPTTKAVDDRFAALIGAAPANLDTLQEIATQLASDESAVAALTTTVGTKLAKASNLSDLQSASTARANLGVAIGSNVQAFSADLAAIAALSPSNDDVLQRKGDAWTPRTIAQLKTDLGYTIDGLLPAQTGNDGKFLTTNGTVASWATVAGGSGITSINGDTGSAHTISGGDDISVVTSGDVTTVRRTARSGAPYYRIFPHIEKAVSGAAGGPGNNQVRFLRWQLDYRWTISKASWILGALVAGSFASVGVYNATGTALLIDTGPQAWVGNSTINFTWGAGVTLEPDAYILAWTNSIQGNWTVLQYDATMTPLLNANGVPQFGTTANASSGGQLPPTTGALTGVNSGSYNLACIKLQG